MSDERGSVPVPGLPLLEIRGLRVSFASEAGPVSAVRGVDLALAAGETLALVGDKQAGPARERYRDHHALAHAARYLVRILIENCLGVGDLHTPQHVQRPLPRFCLRYYLVGEQRLGDLIAQCKYGIERGHRLLEDHGDAVAAYLANFVFANPQQVAALE